MYRPVAAFLSLFLPCLASVQPALAAVYPTRTVTLVVGFTPGGQIGRAHV